MIELRRIILIDWYLFRAEQIDLGGLTALIGPNGAGKSAVIDAVQTVLTGANLSSIRFNPSAQSTSRSKRSIRDYCLGVVSLDEKGERSQPTREHAYTYIILGFRDSHSGEAINLGVSFSASAMRADERCEARFLVKGGLIALDDLLEPLDDNHVEPRQWHSARTLFRSGGLDVVDDFGSAAEFVEEALRSLSPPGFPLDPRRFIKAFRNALLLKPVDNPTEFVRNYVLDVPTIHVDRLRRSIELYRDLSGKIERLREQSANLSQIQRIVARINENERVIHITEWQIARLYWERFHREIRQLQADLNRLHADAESKRHEAAAVAARLSRVEVDAAQVELTLRSSDGEQLALMYESDRKVAVAERENAFAPVQVIESLVRCVENLTERRVIAGRDDILHGLLSSVALAHKPVNLSAWRSTLCADWEPPAFQLDAALRAVLTERLLSVQQLGADSLFVAQKEVHDIQERVQQIDRNLQRLDDGRSPIEAGTETLIETLEAAGIHAEPLCDLVEVKNQQWRLAAEAALGRSREALIVEPTHAVRALEIYRRGSEERFRFAEVVNTTKSAQTRPADKGSLATVLTTSNRHARAFLDFRLGRLQMVESMEKVLALESAITPDRMMQSGRTVKRLSHPGYLKLGRTTTEETRTLLRRERLEAQNNLGEKVRIAQKLKEDAALIDTLVLSFDEMRSKNISCVTVGRTLAESDRKIAGLAANVEEARRSRDPKLLERQTCLRLELEGIKREKVATEKAWQDAHGAENRIRGNLEKLIRDDYDRIRVERRKRARFLKRYPSAESESEAQRFGNVARKLAVDQLQPEIEGMDADVQRRVSDRRQNLQRELSSGLLKHCQQFEVSLPFSDQDAKAEIVGPWAAGEKSRLESHELVKYEEQCRNAAGEMTAAFRDDLLHRLHDAFEGIRETLSDLNRHLKDRQFHGRDYYVFRSNHDPAHADMIELVQDSRRPDFQLPLFSEPNGEDADTPVWRAVRKIEKILADPEARTDEIEDPRKYFNFELYIQDEAGRVRSSLSSRAGTGSGGEGQLPFYIAIGASLAATYQNKRTGQTGLALAVFDEAFNRLDTKAICACSDFMRTLGLQVIVATPDEKRHIFMEIADTIINVNRSGNVVMIDTELLTEKTRQALAEIDPYRQGIDAFKAALIVSSTSPVERANERQEAAE